MVILHKFPQSQGAQLYFELKRHSRKSFRVLKNILQNELVNYQKLLLAASFRKLYPVLNVIKRGVKNY